MTQNNDILDESTKRTTGASALTSNIEAAKAVASIIKTTLGPMGMDKMLIDSTGESIITNDGVKILKEMEIEHPGAKMLVEVAKTQENEVGDGTTTAVIFSGELLSNAQELLFKKIHPTTIIKGYKLASDEALKVLTKSSVKVDPTNKKMLTDLCSTAMTGKVAEFSKEILTQIIFEAVNFVKDEKGISKKNIKILKATGGDTKDSFIVEGVVLDRDVANFNMPKKISNAKILLVDFPLEIRELDSDAKVNINSVEEYEEFVKSEENYLRNIVSKIKEVGANVVVCQKGIDDNVAYYLAKEGIMGIRRSRKSDLERLSLTLGVSVISNIEELNSNNLGKCKSVKVEEILNENYIFVEGFSKPKSVTLFLKASTRHFLDEIERAVDDVLGDISSILNSKRIVAGGGAIELELYMEVMKFSKTFSGKEQLVVENYAKSFLSIPKILCENSGLDEIDTIAKLISEHEKGKTKCGINSFKGVVNDTIKEGIIEPINIKSQAIKSSTENSSMILRIDDIIAAKKLTQKDLDSMSDF